MNNDIFVFIEHLKNQVSDISYIMSAAARDLSATTGGNVVGILLGKDVETITNDLGVDRVLYINHPVLADFTSDAYLIAVESILSAESPRAILFGNTSIGAGIASMLSARLNLPLVSSCLNFNKKSDELNLVSQICGGKVMVETALPETTTLITLIPGGYKPEEGQSGVAPEIYPVEPPTFSDLRIQFSHYVEPEIEDIDITKEPILIAVGRGIQTEDNIELAEELADLLGGAICASRPVVDQGWLPTSRMVGKSGKKVKSNLYLALGISGAPEHIEGIADCENIIAINTDPTAPIFDIAKYGAEIDLLDLAEVLIEMIEDI